MTDTFDDASGDSSDTVADSGDPSEHWTLTRRRFLFGAGAAGVVNLAAQSSPARAAALAPGTQLPAQVAGGSTIERWVRRREDGLLLRFEFFNLRRDAGRGRLRRISRDEPAYVVVHFPPQHIYEQAYFETEPNLDPPPPQPGDVADPGGSETPDAPPVGARLAGESRLAFLLPSDLDIVPLDVETLLGWVDWTQNVVNAAQPPRLRPRRTDLRINEPGPEDTAIELPWWLILSPHRGSAWAHADSPVARGGRTELWHTRLAVRDDTGTRPRVDEDDDTQRTVRAIWARDPLFSIWIRNRQGPPLAVPPTPPATGSQIPDVALPFRSSLVPRDRYDIVASSADYLGSPAGPRYVPNAVDVEQLMLTPMGAWIDSQGQWDIDDTGTSLEDWTQRGTHGRDHYVRIIRAGFLAPTGHRCSLIKITERKFQTPNGGPNPIGYLRQRLFIVVRERVKDFFGTDPLQFDDGRRFPFRSVELLTEITPNLDQPATYVSGLDNQLVFSPRVAGAPFRFQARFTDVAGRPHDIALPLVFVDAITASEAVSMQSLRDNFNAGTVGEPATTEFEFRDRIAVAPPSTQGGDDTTLDVVTMTWGLDDPQNFPPPPPVGDSFLPRFTPTMQEASVRFSAAEEASGGPLPPATVVLDSRYLTNGIDGVAGGIFATLKDPNNPVPLGYGSSGNGDRVGGAVEPSIGITAVSRGRGVVGGSDLETLRNDTFDPAEFFGLGGASLLGDIPLSAVIAPLTGSLDDAPVLDQRIIRDPSGTPIASEVRLAWATPVKAFSPPGAPNLFEPRDPNDPAALSITAVRVNDLVDPNRSTSEVTGLLRNFDVNLFGDGSSALGFIGVQFNRLSFVSLNGAKPVIDADVEEVEFRDPLKFIDKLDPYLRSAGLGGLTIDLVPTGVTVGYSIALPEVSIGVFSLQNLAINAGLTIPFTGQPVRLRFGFCTRENPFLLTVSALGGGGFVGLAIGADGVEMVEAALEAGAQISLNIGVASGSVYCFLGIYFKVEAQPGGDDKVELTGYVRLGGKIDVMGLISLSLEFYLAFTYEFTQNKVTGQAKLTVEIQVLVFSGSVTLSVERRYGGSNDPTFGELMTEPEWVEYAGAFAA